MFHASTVMLQFSRHHLSRHTLSRHGIACLLLLALAPTHAPAISPEELRMQGQFEQGGMVQGYAPPGVQLHFGKRRLRIAPDGFFVIGFGRDAPPEVVLQLRSAQGGNESLMMQIRQREYETQRIDGLPSRMVAPSEKDWERIKDDNRRIGAARRLDSPEAFFIEGFEWPLQGGRISGVYGSRRILNGQPKNPHYGIDIAAPAGTPVRAPAAAVVTLAETDMYYTGGTLILDHGHGVSSTLIHLRKLLVEPGERVERGQVIGEVGATGRATGPHLDWRINLLDIRLDPALVAGAPPF